MKLITRHRVNEGQLASLLIGLQLCFGFAYVDAFHFWSSAGKFLHSSVASSKQRLDEQQVRSVQTPPTASSISTSSHNSIARHQSESSATPQMADNQQSVPIELHFEIDAPVGEENSDQFSAANGSLILEDLVNQFEMNFNQKRRDSGRAKARNEQTLTSPQTTEVNITLDHNQIYQRARNHKLAELVATSEPTTLATSKPDNLEDDPITEQPLSLRSTRTNSSSGSLVEPAPNDSLVESQEADLSDRQIHYDTLEAPANVELVSVRPKVTTIERASKFISANASFVDSNNQDDHDEVLPTTKLIDNTNNSPIKNDHENFVLEPIKSISQPNVGNANNDELIFSNNTLIVLPSQQRQVNHQARSMSAIGLQQHHRVVGPPNHSKAPYANYNLFHVQARNQASENQQSSQLIKRQSIGANQENSNNYSSMDRIQTRSGFKSDLSRSESQMNSFKSTSVDDIKAQNRDNEATTTTTTTTSSTTTTARPPTSEMDAQLYANRASEPQIGSAPTRRLNLNELVDLSPIPAPSGQSAVGASHYFYPSLEESAAQFDSPRPSFDQSQNQDNFGRYFQNDRAHDGLSGTLDASPSNRQVELQQQQPTTTTTPLPATLSEPANQLMTMSIPMSGNNYDQQPLSKSGVNFKTGDKPTRTPADSTSHIDSSGDESAGTPMSSHPLGSASASSLSLPFGPQLNKKTLELLSNQIQHSDSNLLQQQQQQHQPMVSMAHQHKERSPNSLDGLHRDTPPSYAASLVNVTAPLTPPLSATEAMELSLGADQAARQLMHQVGGGSSLGLAASSTSFASIQSADSTQDELLAGSGPSTTSQRPTPPPRSSSFQMSDLHGRVPASIYSRPANSFSPRPINSLTTGQHNALEQQQQHTGSTTERDRLRLAAAAAAASGQQASGFRSPNMNVYLQQQHQAAAASSMGSTAAEVWPHTTSLPTPSSYLSSLLAAGSTTSGRFQSLPSAGSNQAATNISSPAASSGSPSSSGSSTPSPVIAQLNRNAQQPTTTQKNSTQQVPQPASLASTTNGFITSSMVNSTGTSSVQSADSQPQSSQQVVLGGGNSGDQSQALNKRVFNLTRVEHISAECSNDLIRTIIIFNGTFKGIIYSSGYVRDSNCLYINGTGKTRYDFSIRLNQCGTLARQELHPPAGPNEIRRRDQVMWNTLSIQYNPIIEQEWDEHFRVSCEYGSDFWKTISFSPFNVETNTGSPVVFTVDPPQCQMEILKGHGMVGPRQEAITGPVTVGDPLTLLIHMKSEKAGYDILVKNCIAHNGGQQKMQLIDSNGCVVNERFISPFRGTYNDNDLKHVTLYSYLKAFRFTGSPVLYLECEVHMCQSACPPQMCYWRRLSKRSANSSHLLLGAADSMEPQLDLLNHYDQPDDNDNDLEFQSFRFNLTVPTTTTTTTTSTTTMPKTAPTRHRKGRKLTPIGDSDESTSSLRPLAAKENLSDRVSLFQALEVRQEREPEQSAMQFARSSSNQLDREFGLTEPAAAMCYRRAQVFAFLFTAGSILLAAVGLTIGSCCRISSLKRQARRLQASAPSKQLVSAALGLSNAGLAYAPLGSPARRHAYLVAAPSPSSSSSSNSSSTASCYWNNISNSTQLKHQQQQQQSNAKLHQFNTNSNNNNRAHQEVVSPTHFLRYD